MEKKGNIEMVCEQCEQTVILPVLSHRQKAVCPTCGNTLITYRRNEMQASLAWAISALLFLLLSLPFNFLTFRSSGQTHHIDLPGSVAVLIDNDYLSLAIITSLATLILPGMVLVGIVTLIILRIQNRRPPFLLRLHHLVVALLPWSMAEIFLVGTLVSLIKVTSLADVTVGLSFFSFVGFTLSMTVCLVYYDANRMALWIHKQRLPKPQLMDAQTATVSIQRTWALLFTATLLYIPANTLPIMHTKLFGRDDPNTIVGGIISLWQSGSYPIALIILLASVVVPIAKITILAWLNYGVQSGHLHSPATRMRYYRFTEWIGRWSMIDVFVVAVLVALIQLGNTISIYPGPAALAFCAVVFVTMIAAMTFDSRLIWQSRKQFS